jgi:tRNA pseudouridine38-40 synthase
VRFRAYPSDPSRRRGPRGPAARSRYAIDPAPFLRSTPRYLLRFGYDGQPFDGWARQPGRRTVEGEILRGMVRLGLAPDEARARVSVSSRTDRGVSARGNTLALSVALAPEATLRAVNGISPAIRFTHLAEIPDRYDPRAVRSRHYRYWERPARSVPARWRAAARVLTGRIDARSFGRGIPAERPHWRSLDAVTPRIEQGWLVLDVEARSFVWGMVRKLVSALRAMEEGALSLTELRAAVAGRARLALPLAEPERLVLWETRTTVPWTIERTSRSPRQERHALAEIRAAGARARILASVWDAERDRAT